MSDPVDVANKDSALYRTLAELPVVNPFTYQLATSMGPYVKHNRQAHTKNWPYGTPVTYDVPKTGLWRSAHIKLGVTFPELAAGQPAVQEAANGKYRVLRCFKYIELRTRDGLVQRVYPYDFIEQFYTIEQSGYTSLVAGPAGLDDGPSQLIQPGGAAGGVLGQAVTHHFYVKLPLHIFARPANYIDTNFTEPLQLRVMVCDNAASVSEIPGVTLTGEIVYDFMSLDAGMQATYKAHLASKGARGVTRLAWNTVQHVINPAANDTAWQTEAHDITAKFPVFKMVIAVAPSSAAPTQIFNFIEDAAYRGIGEVNQANRGAPQEREGAIERIELLSSGVPFRTWDKHELRMEMHSSGKYHSSSRNLNYFVINFNWTKDINDQTGFLSFRHVSQPQFKLTGFDQTTNWPADHSLYVTYFYYTEMAIEPIDGNITMTTLS